MPDVLYFVFSTFAAAAALLTAGFGVARALPNLVGLAAVVLVELGLLTQLVTSIVLATGTVSARANLPEFFVYLVVALLVPVRDLASPTRRSFAVGRAGFAGDEDTPPMGPGASNLRPGLCAAKIKIATVSPYLFGMTRFVQLGASQVYTSPRQTQAYHRCVLLHTPPAGQHTRGCSSALQSPWLSCHLRW